MCEHVVNAMSTGGEVPAQLTARMLKYTILRKRMVDIAKREALRKVYMYCISIIISCNHIIKVNILIVL